MCTDLWTPQCRCEPEIHKNRNPCVLNTVQRATSNVYSVFTNFNKLSYKVSFRIYSITLTLVRLSTQTPIGRCVGSGSRLECESTSKRHTALINYDVKVCHSFMSPLVNQISYVTSMFLKPQDMT